MSEKLTPELIRVSQPTMVALEAKLAKINKARDKLPKKRLTKGDMVALGVANLTIEMGIQS